MALSALQGTDLVRLARRTLDSFVMGGGGSEPGTWNGYLGYKRGVFVTLNIQEGGEERLRGCIGFPFPVKELGQAVVEATVAAASTDPRFPPVAQDELESIRVEVSALTQPEVIRVGKRIELPSAVEVGTDGLIVSNRYQSGLLLPKVAVDFNLKPEDFLGETCIKAGLPPDAWLSDGVVVQKFQAEVYAEVSPRGPVERFRL